MNLKSNFNLKLHYYSHEECKVMRILKPWRWAITPQTVKEILEELIDSPVFHADSLLSTLGWIGSLSARTEYSVDHVV